MYWYEASAKKNAIHITNKFSSANFLASCFVLSKIRKRNILFFQKINWLKY